MSSDNNNSGVTFETLEISRPEPNSRVFHVTLNRPSTHNSLTPLFFTELSAAVSSLDADPRCHVIVLASSLSSPFFSSGLHLPSLSSMLTSSSSSPPSPAHASHRLLLSIRSLQDSVSSLERCSKPVLAAVHGGCIGGGVDLITACDVRFCTREAYFSVKEVDVAITADLGTLQRLPTIVGYGNAFEMAITGRRVGAEEAKAMGLVSRVFDSREELIQSVNKIAEEIASKSPLAVTGTKAVLVKSRDTSVDQGLDYVATWNAGMLMSSDLKEAVDAHLKKRKPVFAKL
ncbi:hypothetical protein MLD38_004298 [Melastoma candidum]|uniref:Uncharacterized protein n=1 Tax=Melastoma candidum TaxID=119954 RepID=A0ACB9SDV4_9MYRT|nr:hypothetical protein MLD38_004298 [Melastoma candidum]